MKDKLKELEQWLANFSEKYDSGVNKDLRDKDKIASGYSHLDKDFYRNYAIYLNSRTELLKRKNEHIVVRFDETEREPGIIFEVLNKNRKKVLRKYNLKSDQFGFSRPDQKFTHPYAVYLKKVLENDLKNGENNLPKAKENVEKWIKITRQVGGSFFWPMEKKNGIFDLNPEYNRKRGNASYIEDRVDITLFEIYEIYNSSLLKGYRELKRNILVKSCETVTLEWLLEFNSFEEYVEFFAFEPFVEAKSINGEIRYVPYNLLDFELKEFSFGNQQRKRALYKLSEEESSKELIEQYKYLFKNVVDRVEKRNKLLSDFANKDK